MVESEFDLLRILCGWRLLGAPTENLKPLTAKVAKEKAAKVAEKI
jgi:hypothetical protein